MVDLDTEYRAHAADLVRYATVLVGPHDANDVVNEAVTATIARGSLEQVSDVRGYWFRAVTNTAASWHRSGIRRRRREDRVARRDLVVVTDIDADDARRVLRALSVQQRAVMYLTYWHDWDPARIAEALGVADGTVRKQLARGREQLREALRDE